jgi:MOSC domain-containing protein YiiM
LYDSKGTRSFSERGKNMTGKVAGIFIASAARAELTALDEARVLPGKGLVGDRYSFGAGTFSRLPGTGRAMTLIESEVIEDVASQHGLDLAGGRSRRNIVTTGLRLNEVVGRCFRIGTALFRAMRLAEPCSELEQHIGPGLQEALRGRGGLRADALEEGVIHVGDVIEVLALT